MRNLAKILNLEKKKSMTGLMIFVLTETEMLGLPFAGEQLRQMWILQAKWKLLVLGGGEGFVSPGGGWRSASPGASHCPGLEGGAVRGCRGWREQEIPSPCTPP